MSRFYTPRPVALSPEGQTRFLSYGLLLLLPLVLLPLPNRAEPPVLRLPFRSVKTFILVEGKVNGKPAIFLLDTGANRTIVSTRAYGNVEFELRRARHNRLGAGLVGDSLRLQADVVLANRTWVGQTVSVMNLDDLNRVFGMGFDGLLGQDILRQFRAVRINYKDHVIELEQ